jgi:small subunit ribosomal protein S25
MSDRSLFVPHKQRSCLLVMPRKPLPGPSRLSQILKRLQQEPIPSLPALSSLRLTYAIRNDHFGAR